MNDITFAFIVIYIFSNNDYVHGCRVLLTMTMMIFKHSLLDIDILDNTDLIIFSYITFLRYIESLTT